jgi:hypothetical protein
VMELVDGQAVGAGSGQGASNQESVTSNQ